MFRHPMEEEIKLARSSREEFIKFVSSSTTDVSEIKELQAGWVVKTQTEQTFIYYSDNASLYLSDHLGLDTTVRWISDEEAATTSCNQIVVSWRDFIEFLEGKMTRELQAFTEQELSHHWRDFQETRALMVLNYTPRGVLVEAIHADSAEPWSIVDYTKPMQPAYFECVAFRGHGEMGWPKSFLRKLFEFCKPE